MKYDLSRFFMAKIVTIVNQKGGVGKTTTAVNIAAYLNKFGKRVLLIDLDPQANATSGLGIDHKNLEQSIYHTLLNLTALEKIILPTGHEHLHVAPATQELAGARIELVGVDQREFRLQQALESHKAQYDYVIIDCPPSLDLLTVNGLVASDEVLIPIQSEYYALEGLGQLLGTIQLVQDHLNPGLKIMGGVITLFDQRNRLSQQVVEELYQHFPHKIFHAVVPRNVRLSESPSYGQTILVYDPASKGAQAYEQLTQEILALENSADVAGSENMV